MKHAFYLAFALLATSGAAEATTLYTNDFSSNANDFSGLTSIATAPSGQTFLGQFGPGSTSTLSLDTSNVIGPISLSFDLYAIQTVDGDGTAGGNSPSNPDSFVITSNGATLFNYSFANYPGDSQNYPVSGSADQTGASAVNTLGYDNYGDATYAFSNILINPTGALTRITFTSNTNQPIGDEGYGLDNVLVTGNLTATAAVPEPASWALMIAGFGGVGAALRRRKSSGTLTATA